jgi:hypothetical protein
VRQLMKNSAAQSLLRINGLLTAAPEGEFTDRFLPNHGVRKNHVEFPGFLNVFSFNSCRYRKFIFFLIMILRKKSKKFNKSKKK